jgi:hypothetical protein
MERLLAATIEAIFIVYGRPDISVCQCLLSMEKWLELIVSPKQIVLGLVVDTNKMTVGITKDYIQQDEQNLFREDIGPSASPQLCNETSSKNG